ncbi:hypothetical protein BO221_13065 [Archangium sp. Cb G35]|uniref:hypothetical protein n=1 Tax=Archangium sp. Cb G35 TaxID=1920190 RepID=UPI0009356A59|nr:hypothetical protein [Archangium sp. Cb G35]OJT25270.1 hypothetical protein BO221_13065 [Archangium sp. Cb G35]
MKPGNDGKGQGAEGPAAWRQRIGSGTRTAVRFLLGYSRFRASLVSNQTDRRLKIRRPDNTVLVLSPLECDRRVSAQEVEAFDLQALAQRGRISLQPEPSRWVHRLAFIQSFTGKLSLLSFIAAAYFFLIDLFEGRRARTYLLIALGLMGASLVSMLLVARLGSGMGMRRSFKRWVRGKVYPILLLAIGVGIPSLVILASEGFIGDLRKVLEATTVWVRSAGQVLPEVSSQDRLLVAGRFLQLLFISLLSLLPAVLFFAFDRQHQSTLRERFVAHIFRFDPAVETRQDVQTRYGKQMDEAYGTEGRDGTTRLLPTRRSPLLIATLVLALGWTFTMLSGGTPADGDSPVDFLGFFQPLKSTLPFGFLGAYAYALATTFRSYARRDLQPKIYSHITTRVFTVMVLAWVLEESWLIVPGSQVDQPALEPALHTLAFLTGIIPETGLVFIGEVLRTTLRKLKRPAKDPGLQLVDPHEPLTSLEGIDIYDRARLQDEGVTNVQALARHDVVELMLQTRVPAPRLLDWVDQAILHLHCNVGGQTGGEPDSLLPTLRRYGIRTVTDLMEASDRADKRSKHDEFLQLLSGSASNGSIPRLQIVLDAIKDEEWVENLRCWHKTQAVREEVVDVQAPPRAPRPEPRESTDRASRPGAVTGRRAGDGAGAPTVA